MKLKYQAIAVLAAVALAPSAWALSTFTVVNGGSTEGWGAFSGTVTYDPSASAELTISLTNTSPIANGGYITGIAFDLGGTVTALTAPNSSFSFVVNPSVSPYGDRNWGSALGGDWLGGSNPTLGIAVGATGTWTFDVVGGPAALDYQNLDMLVRFKGFKNGGSDKVAAVPEPEAYAMALAALGVIGFFGRVRRRKA